MNAENSVSDGLFDFNCILEKIKLRRLTNLDKFIEEMKNYIHQILKTGQPSVHLKKSKHFSKMNGTRAVEKLPAEINSFSFSSLLTSEQIKTLQEDSFTYLDSLVEQKMRSAKENLNWSALVKQMDNLTSSRSSHLDLVNRKKLTIFSKRLRETQLSAVFQTKDTNKSSTFNLLADIEEEVHNEVPADQQNDVDSMPVAVVPVKTLAQKEEMIRCICGIMREEGKMIQCDQCEVTLHSFVHFYFMFLTFFISQIWQHLECVEQFCKIDQSEGSDYHCEKCKKRDVSLVSSLKCCFSLLIFTLLFFLSERSIARIKVSKL